MKNLPVISQFEELYESLIEEHYALKSKIYFYELVLSVMLSPKKLKKLRKRSKQYVKQQQGRQLDP